MFLRDIRYSLRTLAKARGFAIVTVVTIALGIGANTAIFSVIDAVLLKPLPYRDPDRLLMVWEKPPGSERNGISAANFLDWRNQNHVFEQMSAITGESYNLADETQPEQIHAAKVSANFFDLLGVKPAWGRTFFPAEDQPGRDHAVVLSHRLWKRRFGGNTNLIGQDLRLNGEKYTVVGVLKPKGNFDRGWAEMWTPLALDPANITRDFHFLQAFARLKPNVTKSQAQAEMDTIASNIAREYPKSNKGWGVTIDTLREQVVGRQLRQTLLILLGTVIFVLLIACANVASLMVARVATRQKEISIRLALGAGRWRLISQLLTESISLAALGGAFGLLLAHWLLKLFSAMMPRFTLPNEADIVMDYRILLFTLGISLLTGILFGSVPAWQASNPNLNDSLKDGGRGATTSLRRHRFRSALVISEVALALVLLVGAGLLIRSFAQLQHVNPGFDPHNVLTMSLSLPQTKYSSGERVAGFYQQTIERIRTLPGVKSAAVASDVPLRGWSIGMPFAIEGRPPKSASELDGAHFQMIGADYFRAMGIPLMKGRSFTEADRRESQKVAIVNQRFVHRFFPHEDPLGKKLLVEELISGKPQLGPSIAWQIVGVIGDVKVSGLGEDEASAEIYVPYTQSPWPGTCLVVSTLSDPMAMANSVKSAIREMDKDQPVTEVKTMEQIMTESVSQPLFRMRLLGMFALLALVLASVGIYGLMSYSVSQRTGEIGVRMALGAQPADVLKLVVWNGMRLALVGITIGLAASIAFTRLMASLIFGVSARDPLAFVSVALLLSGVALIACYFPARRATKVDPLVALRYE